MQIKFMDWRSDFEVEEERLALTYHMNSNHYPQLDVLTRSRMKMLKKLFAQMNVEATPAKRYFAAPRYELRTEDLKAHPFMRGLMTSLSRLQEAAKPYLDFEPLLALGSGQPDSPDVYILSKNRDSGKYELFYCRLASCVVERVKEAEPAVWSKLFNLSLAGQAGEGAVFITANLNRALKLFGERGYRLSLLEGGRLTERLLLCSHGTGWELQPLMTFYDLAAKELLGIDGQYEVVLSCLIIREEDSACTSTNS